MRRATIATFSTLAAAGIFAAAVFGQPGQRPGGGTRGGFGGGFNLDSDWALVCFKLETEDQLLPQLRKVFRKAYDLRAEVIEAMRSGEIGREDIAEEMAAIQEELAESLEKILGKERTARLQELRSQRQNWQGSRGGGNRRQNRED
jgi:hypothetical protein